MGYSYVVIRRGPRPEAPGTKSGRIGEVGKRELEKQDAKQPLSVLQLHEDFIQSQGTTEPVEEVLEQEETPLGETVVSEDPETMQNSLRQEAYHWPRLVFAPLKRSGHIILDACAPEGKVIPSLSFLLPNVDQSFSLRKNSSNDRTQVARQTAFLRCSQVGMGRSLSSRAQKYAPSSVSTYSRQTARRNDAHKRRRHWQTGQEDHKGFYQELRPSHGRA